MNNQLRAVKFFRNGSSSRLAACLAASRLERGDLGPLAEELAITKRAVNNMKFAGIAYRELRRFGSQLPKMARTIGYSHMAVTGRMLAKAEIEPEEAWEEIRTAYEERTNIVAFRDAVEGGPDWNSYFEGSIKKVEKLISSYGVPEEVREIGVEFLDKCKEWQGTVTKGDIERATEKVKP